MISTCLLSASWSTTRCAQAPSTASYTTVTAAEEGTGDTASSTVI